VRGICRKATGTVGRGGLRILTVTVCTVGGDGTYLFSLMLDIRRIYVRSHNIFIASVHVIASNPWGINDVSWKKITLLR